MPLPHLKGDVKGLWPPPFMCIDPSGGGGASSSKPFTISCYIFISPAGNRPILSPLWQWEAHSGVVLHICFRNSLKCLLKSSLCQPGSVLQSSLIFQDLRRRWGRYDIQYVVVQPIKPSLNILLFVTEQAFDVWYVCVCICMHEWKMTRWHLLVSCKLSLTITCRF